MEPATPHSVSPEGIAISPALEENLESIGLPPNPPLVTKRTLYVCLLAVFVAAGSSVAAQALTGLIGFITNLAFYGTISFELNSPAHNQLGLWVIPIPVIGGLIVGLMARYGSEAIRGHGIPEAMQQIAFHKSKIPARMTFLKPVSSAVAIGTGGPFGAEGPIIATGGALGSLLGQVTRITDDERKTLLASGAAAGMAAIFLSPISAVILAIELLLFEYRPRSVIPVALASVTATGMSMLWNGQGPVFPMDSFAVPELAPLLGYVLMGALLGLVAVGITKLTYYVEELFEKLPIHWMWWPMIGALAVGVIGYFVPRTLGVGYDNIEAVLSGSMTLRVVLVLVGFKFLSWVIALGSGTSGGTLAPLLTIGGGAGSALGSLFQRWVPHWGIDVRVSALIGMAALFAGASRAFLASVLFAFETTRQPAGLLPLLAACSAAYLVSCLCMRHSIMTEKLARRGTPISTEISVDSLENMTVGAWTTREVVALSAQDTIESVRALAGRSGSSFHQGFPVVDADGNLIGVLTRRDWDNEQVVPQGTVHSIIRRPPVTIYEDNSLREAIHRMLEQKVGRLIVVSRREPRKIRGILTRNDILAAHEPALASSRNKEKVIQFKLKRLLARS